MFLTQPEAIPIDPAVILAPLADSLAQQGGIGHIPEATVLADTLNVRAGPGTDYDVLERLASGAVIEVWGVDQWPGYTWLHIWSGENWGWIAADVEYVQMEEGALQHCSDTDCSVPAD